MAFTQISGNGLKNNSITNAHLHSGAAIAGTKISPDFGSQNIATTGNITSGSNSSIFAENNLRFKSTGDAFIDHNTTGQDINFRVSNSSSLDTTPLVVNASGISVTGNIAVSGTVDGRDLATDGTKLDGIAANANNYSFPYTISTDRSNGTVVRRVDPGGYIYASYFNTAPNDIATGSITKICAESGNDGFIRHATAAAVRSFLNVANGANNVTNYVTKDASDTLTGATYTISNAESQKIILSGATNPYIRFQEGTTNKAYIQWDSAGYFLMVNQESGEHVRIGSGNNGLQFVVDGTARNVIHSNNVQSYALRTVGGTLSGSLTIGDGTNQARLLLKKQDNNVSDHIIFYNGTTRIGEIGCEDNSWLRINQETAKNIYTPRLIRADNGFQVDGNTVIDGSANHQVVGNCDIRFNNGTWSGNHCKIQHHSDYLYIVGGSNGIIFREAGTTRWFIDGSGHFIPNGTNNYNIGSSSNRVNNIYGGALFLGQASRYLSNADGDYGSVQINGSGQNGWEGFSIDGRAVFMHNGSTSTGLYNDVNNEWLFYSLHNDYSAMYFNGSQKIKTENYGCKIAGTCRPHVTNGGDSGASDARWGTVYASNGSINTSDRNEKNTIIDSDLGLNFINKLKAVSYKWNDEELGEKTHYGLIAQDIEETIKEIGKDVDNIGMIDKPEKGAMGLNYNELIAPLVKAIQELSAKVAALETA